MVGITWRRLGLNLLVVMNCSAFLFSPGSRCMRRFALDSSWHSVEFMWPDVEFMWPERQYVSLRYAKNSRLDPRSTHLPAAHHTTRRINGVIGGTLEAFCARPR